MDASKTRIACQPSLARKLENKFYLLKDHDKKENEMNYCSLVLDAVRKQTENNATDESSNQESYLDKEQEHFKQCEMESLTDSSCKAIFYHNDIDGNQHFRRDVDGAPVCYIYKLVFRKLYFYLCTKFCCCANNGNV